MPESQYNAKLDRLSSLWEWYTSWTKQHKTEYIITIILHQAAIIDVEDLYSVKFFVWQETCELAIKLGDMNVDNSLDGHLERDQTSDSVSLSIPRTIR
jgi:hypothetical protein